MGSYLGVSFGRLIEAIYRTHGSVVVLVDEYDKALVNVLDDNATFDCNQATLAPFCGVLKRQDDKIRFGMLTGVSQFAKMNIFSGLNNLWDISTLPEYANIVGFSNAIGTRNQQGTHRRRGGHERTDLHHRVQIRQERQARNAE